MKTIQTRRCQMLGRIVEFGEQYGHLFPKSSEAGETFAAVAAAVKLIGEHTRSRLSSESVPRDDRASARESLRERLDAMARVAQTIGETTPGFANKFELPAEANDQELVEAGRLFVQNAESVKERFVAHAFPTTFLADVSGLVAAFEESVHERDAAQVRTAVAMESIGAAIDAGTASARKLDVMMRVALKSDRAMTAAWERARRVQYRNRVRVAARVPDPATPATEPPAPATEPPAATLLATTTADPASPAAPEAAASPEAVAS